jgi:acetylornithine aminotransferase/acetylornithine/N-succinyldiaminopimelate aminotransferase
MATPDKRAAESWSREKIQDLEAKHLFPTYRRSNLYAYRGEGPYLYDIAGERYLDFLSGIAVNSLGYNHPRIVQVILEQAQTLIHCSNLFFHPYQGLLAKRLTSLSGMKRAFFSNSGAEAIETAMKIARAFPRKQGKEGKVEILALSNAFHGRTFGALSVTSQEKYQAPFRPLVPEIKIVSHDSAEALEQAFSDRTCALIVEPVQGEGGVIPLTNEFLLAARRLCDEHDALLIMDEIQCGMARTGKFFAFEHFSVRPDVVTLAKSLAAGYPLGAVLGNDRVADTLGPGQHGTTFGGGPLACRIALEVLSVIEDEGLLVRASEMGTLLRKGLRTLGQKHGCVREVRGLGLMIGAELEGDAGKVVERLLEHKVIANVTQQNVLRLLPPLTVRAGQIQEFLDILDVVLSQSLEARGPKA